MKIFPRVFVGFLCALSASLVSSQAQTFTGATLTLTTAGTDGTLIESVPLTRTATGTVAFASTPPLTLGATAGSGAAFDLGTPPTLGTGLTVNNGVNTINSGSLTLTSGVTSGTLQVGASVSTVTGGTLTLNGAGAGGTLVSGFLTNTGTGSLTFTGAGNLTLGTTAGTITAGSGATLTLGTGVIVTGLTVNSGSVTVTGSTLQLAQPVSTLTGGTLTINGIDTGAISNGGSLNVITAGGTAVLTSGGTLTLNSTGTLSVPTNSTLKLTAVNTPILLGGGTTLSTANVNLPVSTGLTINTAAGEGLKLLPTIGGSGSATKVSFLDGVTSVAGSVSLLYLPAILNLASNPLELQMSEFNSGLHDKYVLQLSYNPATAAALGNLNNLYLAWYDPADRTWKNAVLGDSDGGKSTKFVSGAFDPTTDFNLGTYGVDTANSTVWAVVDHNSTFGVANSQVQPQGVPEPSVAALLTCGLALQLRRTRKR